MYDKMKDKMPGMKGKEEKEEMKKKPMAGIEIEIEGEEEEGMESPEGMEDEEVAVGELAKLSDEELMAEVEKRGMTVSKPEEGKEVASGGSSVLALPEAGEAEEEEEVIIPSRKKKA
jgi:hypothetical protein